MKTNHMISPERLAIHQVAWMRLLESLDVAPADAYPLFDRLVAAYQEPHRHYHNLEHITEMLKIVGKLADSATPLPALQLAVWFHDAVYDPHAKDNEEQSAVLALRELQPLGIPTTTLDRIAALIRATAHVGAADVDTATAILLDADLAILGAEERRYARYAAAIRQEYAWVDDVAYREGRRGVLEAFLKRERIYRTECMHAVGEEVARHNLRSELAQLLREKSH